MHRHTDTDTHRRTYKPTAFDQLNY